MLEAYHDLFNVYLKALKRAYDPKKPYENLEECISMCEHFFWKLQGMLDLLRETKCITIEVESVESERVNQTFSVIKLFGSYQEKGEIMVFVKKESTMSEDPHNF